MHESFVDRLRPHIFLVDGLGAVASAMGTGLLLPALQPWVGLPRDVLIGLAIPAVLFAVYSLSAWRLNARPWPWLGVIAAANLAYCGLVAVTLVVFRDPIQPLGLAYFVGEIAIVVGIAWVERQVWRTSAADPSGSAR